MSLLLGEVLVVRDRQAAKRLVSSIPQSARIVTLKGEVFTGSGIVIAGKDRRASLVGRPRQRRELSDSVEAIERDLENHEAKFGKLREEIQTLRAMRKNEDQELHGLRHGVEASEKELQSAIRNFEQQNQKNEWQKSQLDLLNSETLKTVQELSVIEKSINAGVEQINKLTEKVKETTANLRQITLDEFQTQVVHWNTSLAVLKRGIADAERRESEYDLTLNKIKKI
jgi:chromosome segregation protein